ncbi:MAG TPA: crotonase/enoyl-CoA hydratase family protein [Vineibacter sp.]|nr:crotonase/enoyl-CoA hydratase family protein [Vineibacter sp.]
MSKLLTHLRAGPVSEIIMNDGKANVMSIAMLSELHQAFDKAERDRAIVILTARGRHFSGGFDLNVFSRGSAGEIHTMLKLGSELALRILSFPRPVVAACNGNAFPMGAFLILSSDIRLAAKGVYKIGMNEVAIGLVVPRFAVEVARQRLTPPYFNRAVVTGQMFDPEEAVTAGFFDRTVPAADLDVAAQRAAEALSAIDLDAHAASKLRAREPAIKAIREAIDSDITLAYAEDRVARRAAVA